ncbi:MAG: SDR family oxidoreductase [Ignavibacteriae bacterium]|nr:SDR family oxidoreductase [Ignavibacteriota bacterium]
MAKALITGGAGFIGSHLSELLVNEGHHVTILDNFHSGREYNLALIKQNPCLKIALADIRNDQEILPHFEGIDWVFHLAALADVVPSIEHPREYFEVNVDGTFNVLECARQHRVKKLIYAASSSCYGFPSEIPTTETAKINAQHPYSLTKYVGEKLVLHWEQVYRLPAISLRLFNVFGPRARTTGAYGAVFGIFLTQKLHGRPFTVVGDGTQARDFIYVTDVAHAFYLAAQSSFSGEVFNVGKGKAESINQIVELLKGKAIFLPKRPGEPDITLANISKIQEKLGFAPRVSFEEGIRYLLEKIEDFKDAPLWDKQSIAEATKTWFSCLEDR